MTTDFFSRRATLSDVRVVLVLYGFRCNATLCSWQVTTNTTLVVAPVGQWTRGPMPCQTKLPVDSIRICDSDVVRTTPLREDLNLSTGKGRYTLSPHAETTLPPLPGSGIEVRGILYVPTISGVA